MAPPSAVQDRAPGRHVRCAVWGVDAFTLVLRGRKTL
jgi:hypothetical protein